MTASRIVWLLLLGWGLGCFTVLGGIWFALWTLQAPTEARSVPPQREND